MHQDVINAIHGVTGDHHKLVIVLGEFGSGKTKLLHEVAEEIGGAYLNLNLELTNNLLKIPRSDYADGVSTHNIIYDICDAASPDKRVLMVDNVEILFSPELGRINPIDTFKKIARERVVVIALPARLQSGMCEYSQIGREDYMSFSTENFIVLQMK